MNEKDKLAQEQLEALGYKAKDIEKKKNNLRYVVKLLNNKRIKKKLYSQLDNRMRKNFDNIIAVCNNENATDQEVELAQKSFEEIETYVQKLMKKR